MIRVKPSDISFIWGDKSKVGMAYEHAMNMGNWVCREGTVEAAQAFRDAMIAYAEECGWRERELPDVERNE